MAARGCTCKPADGTDWVGCTCGAKTAPLAESEGTSLEREDANEAALWNDDSAGHNPLYVVNALTWADDASMASME